jgi:rare lipoprotein A
MASFYSDKFEGKKTASGELYHARAMTAAHRKLPFGTRLKVTRLDNGLEVLVTVNDRGPWKKGRILDLSRAAAQKLKMTSAGVARIQYEVIP